MPHSRRFRETINTIKITTEFTEEDVIKLIREYLGEPLVKVEILVEDGVFCGATATTTINNSKTEKI